MNYVNVVPPADLDDSILGSHSSGSPSDTPTTSRENSTDARFRAIEARIARSAGR